MGSSGRHQMLLLLVLLMMTMMEDDLVVSAAASKKLPIRGEMSAVPRGLDMLLGNVAPRSGFPPLKPGRPDNDFNFRSPSPGKLLHNVQRFTLQLKLNMQNFVCK